MNVEVAIKFSYIVVLVSALFLLGFDLWDTYYINLELNDLGYQKNITIFREIPYLFMICLTVCFSLYKSRFSLIFAFITCFLFAKVLYEGLAHWSTISGVFSSQAKGVVLSVLFLFIFSMLNMTFYGVKKRSNRG